MIIIRMSVVSLLNKWNILVFQLWNLMVFDSEMAMYLNIYIWILYNGLMWGHVDLVMLRSTTSPYGRPMLEVAYGEILLSLYRGCMEDDSSGRVVGVSAWCIAHVWHTRVNTSVGSMYIIFGFLNTKTYVYVYWFQNLYVVEKNTGGLWPRPGPMRFRECFQPSTNCI